MARKTTKSTSSTGPAKTRRRRNVRAVTIDLEATEVGEERAKEVDTGPGQTTDTDTQSERPVQPDEAGTNAADPGESPDQADSVNAVSVPVATYLKYGAAGLAGGLLALLIYSGLARFGFAPAPAGGDVTELSGSINQIRQSFERQETDQAARLGNIESRLSGLADNDPGADLTARMDAVESRLTALASEIAAIDAAALQRLSEGQDVLNAEVGALSERLEAVSPSNETGPRLAGFEARLGVLETNTETLLAELQAAASGGTGVAGTDLLALRQSLTSLQATANETMASLTARLDGLDEMIDAADAETVALTARVDGMQSGLDRRIGGLETRVSDLPAIQFTGTGAGAEVRAAASLAFAALERAVREGLPYGAELELLASITAAIPDDIVTALAPAAGTGVPTVADLTKQFETIATIIIEAEAEAGAGDTGLLDQTLTRIRSVVRIRPTGFVEGDSVPAIVARTEAYLNAGQLKEAVGELVALEGPAGEVAAEWFGAAATRLDTGAALVALNRFLLGNARPAETQ